MIRYKNAMGRPSGLINIQEWTTIRVEQNKPIHPSLTLRELNSIYGEELPPNTVDMSEYICAIASDDMEIY